LGGEVEALEDLAAGLPRLVRQLLTVELEDVEDEEGDRRSVGGVERTVHPGGQQLEVGPAVWRDQDHLAVEHDVTHG
jgi:hypothetical protein